MSGLGAARDGVDVADKPGAELGTIGATVVGTIVVVVDAVDASDLDGGGIVGCVEHPTIAPNVRTIRNGEHFMFTSCLIIMTLSGLASSPCDFWNNGALTNQINSI
jgi:hypothetical protein